MCRFLAYKGKPLLMDEILYGPKNSLICQSINAHEMEEPLNGDGFGIGWYTPELSEEPGLFTSIRPAWNDRNLRYLAQKIKSKCFFAHVRAASTGYVNETNCHPFHFKKFLCMHNGDIEGFSVIKRFLRRELSDELYDWIKGQTDSEHFFGLYLHYLKDISANPGMDDMVVAMKKTLQRIEQLKKEHGAEGCSYINCSITDGKVMLALRYVSDVKETASTLYYAEGTRFECHNGVAHMVPAASNEEHSVLIVSEKLTAVEKDWKEIPTNHMITVDEKLAVNIIAAVDSVPAQVKKAS